MTVDVRINRDECVGSGSCARWLPKVFALDSDGLAVVLDPHAASDDDIEDSAEGCPTQAIIVEHVTEGEIRNG